MSITVAEALQTLSTLKFEKAIINQVIEYLDGTFLNDGMVLLTEDRIAVPSEEIEKFAEKLSVMQKTNESAITEVLSLPIPTSKKGI